MCHALYISAFVAAAASTGSRVNEDTTAGPNSHVSTSGKTSPTSLHSVTTSTNEVSKGNAGK